jgi:hypothetical protein
MIAVRIFTELNMRNSASKVVADLAAQLFRVMPADGFVEILRKVGETLQQHGGRCATGGCSHFGKLYRVLGFDP